jgi:hypothetical protein
LFRLAPSSVGYVVSSVVPSPFGRTW